MADNTRTSWDPFLLDMQGAVHEVFPSEAPFLAEMSGYGDPTTVGRITRAMDGNRQVFSGRQVRHVIILAGLAGGGNPGETGTWNAPIPLSSQEVHIKLVDTVVPFSVTVDIERDSFDHAMANAVKTLIEQAQSATSRLENLQMLGDGTGLIVQLSGAGGSPGLTVPVPDTANMDVLLPGTVWDVLTVANGANPGNGLRRVIDSVVETAGAKTVTFDTALQAADGSSGNITFSANEGIFIPGSFGNIGQGLIQAASATGTFEAVNKATVVQWQGVDGRQGDTATKMLSEQMLDKGVRRGRRSGIGFWDFAIGDPACIDGYKQSTYSQRKFEPQEMTLKSGYSGIVYEGSDKPFPLIKEPSHAKTKVHLIRKDAFQLYGDSKGPDFLTDDGGMFRRFVRSSPKEAELMDRWQLGVTTCNRIVQFANLDVAA